MALGHSPQIVRDGLVLYLDAANLKSYPGSGTTWLDLIGNNYNATLVNGTNYLTINKGAFNLDGVNDKIQFNSDINGTFTQNYTITTYFLNDNVLKNTALIGYNRGASPFNKWIAFPEFFGNGTMAGVFDDDIVKQSVGITSISNNTWYESTITYSNNTGSFYVNSSLKGSATVAQPHSLNNELFIGSFHVNDNRYYDGKIAMILVYNRALTVSEIKQNFNALRGRFDI